MRVPRVHVPGRVRPGERIDLPPEEGRHLAKVLRRSPGDPVLLLPDGGGAYTAEVIEVEAGAEGPRVVVLAGREASPGPSGTPWTVAAAVTRGDAFELAIRMAAELGLEALLPLWTARGVVRESGRGKRERWQRIAREAAKQCGRAEPFEVLEPQDLATFLREWNAPVAPAGAPRDARDRRGLQGWIATPSAAFRAEGLVRDGAPAPAIFLVGPEGGFRPDEASRAAAAGFEPIGFPTPVLRTPTAVALIGALGVLLSAPFHKF